MDLAASVRAEQIRALYRQSRLLLWTNVAISAMVSAALWDAARHAWLATWVALLRSELVRRFSRAEPSAADLAPWGPRFVVASMLAGAVWGAGTVLFYDP